MRRSKCCCIDINLRHCYMINMDLTAALASGNIFRERLFEYIVW